MEIAAPISAPPTPPATMKMRFSQEESGTEPVTIADRMLEICEKIIINKERVKQLYEEQKFDISQATIHRGVHTDSEGLTYNSITWADEN